MYDDLYNDMEETGIPNPYSRQGEEQPFGYTGYRHDEISGTYFAQAREYQPQNGRFTAQDVIQGNGAYPETLNRYGYCWGNPVGLVDLDGRRPIDMLFDLHWQTSEERKYSLYYLNNMDGAKIFGHSAILLIDSEGNGEFYSFMGTSSQSEALKGKTSLGYMGYESLTKEEVDKFLNSGDIDVTMADGSKNHDNYDRALKRDISFNKYLQIQEGLSSHVAMFNAGRDLQGQALDAYIKNTQGAGYNLYKYNCDDVALEAIGIVDPLITKLYDGMLKTHPNNSYWVVSCMANESWEKVELGENNLFEKFISLPALYYILYGSIAKGVVDCETE